MIIQDVIKYFTNLNELYQYTVDLYNQLLPYYKKLSKKFEFEVFNPSFIDVLNEVKVDNPTLYSRILKDFKFDFPKTYTINPQKDKIENYIDYIYNSILNEPQQVLPTKMIELSDDVIKQIDNSILKIVSEYKEVDCDEEKKEIEYNEEVFKRLNSELNLSKEEQDFINRCNTKKEAKKLLNKEVFQEDNPIINPTDFEKVMEDCFTDEIPNDIVPIDDNDLSPFEPSVDGTPPPNIDQEQDVLKNLIDLYPDECPCLKDMVNQIDKIKKLSEDYSNQVGKKVDIQKKYSYYKVFETSLKGILDRWGKFPSGLSLSTISNVLNKRKKPISIIGDVKKWSKEIDFKVVKSDKNIKIVDIKIKPIKKPKTSDGAYFKAFEETGKVLKKDKFKNGTATKEEWKKVEDDADKKFESELKKSISETKKKSSDVYRQIFIDLISPSDLVGDGVKSIMKNSEKELRKVYNDVKKESDKFEKEWKDYKKDVEDIKKKLDDTIKETEEKSNESKCSKYKGKNGSVLLNETEVESEEEVDNRELLDPNNPTIYDMDYWKRFCKLATYVNLAPVPQFIGGNDFSVNFRDFTKPDIKIPNVASGIAIDDDGIPRFLFYAIGIIIPTPLSIDGVWRIPLPIVWKPIFLQKIESPMKKITAQLLEYQSKIAGFSDLRKIVNLNGTEAEIFSRIPDGSVEAILGILGVSALLDMTAIKNPLSRFNLNVKGLLRDSINNELNSKLSDANSLINTDVNQVATQKVQVVTDAITKARGGVQNQVDGFRNNIQRQIEVEIEKVTKNFDVTQYTRSLIEYLNDINRYLDLIQSVTSTVGNCLGFSIDDYKKDVDNIIDKLKANLSGGLDGSLGLTGLNFPDFNLPSLDIGSYIIPNINKFIDINLSGVDLNFIDELFPDLTKFFSFIENYILKYVFKVLKFELWKGGFPIKDLLGFQIPEIPISSLSVGLIDFPELILVGMIGFCGVIPYPYVLMINAGDVDVPGVITGRTIQLISLDLKKPIKVIKINFGSYVMPVGTMIEDFINSGLGLYFDPSSLGANVGIPNLNVIKDLNGMIGRYSGLNLDQFLGGFKGLLKMKIKPKNLYNLFEIPNPELLCKMASAKSFSESFELAKSELKINNSVLPPELSKLESLRKYGVFDLNGQMIIDEFKQQFDAINYPKVEDVLTITTEQRQMLLLDKLGISKKSLFDLMPPITMSSIYLQDDLPPYERLQLGNIPFLIFLIEFCIAGKKGAKIPFLPPEVFPYLEMS